MSNFTLQYLENCFDRPSQNRDRKPIRTPRFSDITPEDVRNFEENSLLGMFWSKE